MSKIANRSENGKRTAITPRKSWSQLTYRERARLTLQELDAYDATIEWRNEHREWRRLREKAEKQGASLALHGSAKQRYQSLRRHPTYKHLSPGARSVLHELYKAADPTTGAVSVGVGELTERVGLQRRGVQRALGTLRERAFITVVEGDANGRGGRGKPTVYQLGSYR
ncbi:helix-turn-helix domain-containing protein [Aquisalimonas lutea]|uniref:MarR family transcriptional regulator n=1 Tax=Aquisalimonas lutea TaxID=1327750 RepID=UPI0025B480E4|nr:helix-turn-helix domain-containing protein [Aquisalimonas lutea]MDN3517057.1 helix-turn-helix domain-containing protein [Aquisalimonas lutea]